jgi:hypothetical protein
MKYLRYNSSSIQNQQDSPSATENQGLHNLFRAVHSVVLVHVEVILQRMSLIDPLN